MTASLVIGNADGIRELVESLFGGDKPDEALTEEEREEKRRREEEERILL